MDFLLISWIHFFKRSGTFRHLYYKKKFETAPAVRYNVSRPKAGSSGQRYCPPAGDDVEASVDGRGSARPDRAVLPALPPATRAGGR
jgi:hypothetical protein